MKMSFVEFRELVNQQLISMAKKGDLLTTSVPKDFLWEQYLNSFPEGTNSIYKERREYDCQCCKQFIRNIGNVVIVENGKKISIWEVPATDEFKIVANKLHQIVSASSINSIYLNENKDVGTKQNAQMLESGSVVQWDHFHHVLPNKYVKPLDAIPTVKGKYNTEKTTLLRALKEISLDSVSTTLDLIAQNSLYRGEEKLSIVSAFKKLKKQYETYSFNKELFVWEKDNTPKCLIGFRNSSIGSLLIDISEGVDLVKAVTAYEKKVAPENYKRTSSVITKSMISKAEKTIAELGYINSLKRRHATLEDITINDILFADRSTKKELNVFDKLIAETPTQSINFDRVEEVNIKTFIETIIPTSTKVELFVDNKMENNLVSLIAPENKVANNMLTWSNGFSWSYYNDVTDSIKANVEKAGGNTEGVLRASLQWNENDDNYSDLDLHCIEPNGNVIYFQNARQVHASSGMLDIDITEPKEKGLSNENIIWTNKDRLLEGKYTFLVHNYTKRAGNGGFKVEIAFKDKSWFFEYPHNPKNNSKTTVMEAYYTKKEGFKVVWSLDEAKPQSKNIWNIYTEQFVPVNSIMYSPNHWDIEEGKGNKHFFFMLENCNNPNEIRGIYNEFLKPELREHRKVLEILGSKLMVQPSNHQLSGVGFSSTKHCEFVCRVTGSSLTRLLKIKI